MSYDFNAVNTKSGWTSFFLLLFSNDSMPLLTKWVGGYPSFD